MALLLAVALLGAWQRCSGHGKDHAGFCWDMASSGTDSGHILSCPVWFWSGKQRGCCLHPSSLPGFLCTGSIAKPCAHRLHPAAARRPTQLMQKPVYSTASPRPQSHPQHGQGEKEEARGVKGGAGTQGMLAAASWDTALL